ncbi:MAG: type II toxin-antitoxin system HicA family toxin [Bacteroidota bacterium]
MRYSFLRQEGGEWEKGLPIAERFCIFAGVKCTELLRILRKDGWVLVRQAGSHKILRHRHKKGQIVVPDHGSDELGKGLERKILKDAGIK